MQFNLTLTECSKTRIWTCKIKMFPGEKPPDSQPNTGGRGKGWDGRGGGAGKGEGVGGCGWGRGEGKGKKVDRRGGIASSLQRGWTPLQKCAFIDPECIKMQ